MGTPHGPPRRESFETTDPQVCRELLRDAYGSRYRFECAPEVTRFALSRVSIGSVTIDEVDSARGLDVLAGAADEYRFGMLRAGRIQRDTGTVSQRMGPGDVLLNNQPGLGYRAWTRSTNAQVAVLGPSLFGEVTGTTGPVRFTGYAPLTAAGAHQFVTTMAHVKGLLDTPETADEPLVTAAAARLLAATALATFPNSTTGGYAAGDRNDATPTTLRRAIAFIDSNSHRDICVADIAGAAHVGVRALQLAFRRHLGTTPMAYLRLVRLDLAHAELLAADPAGATVTAIATRWGFANLGRFTTWYRAEYCEPPSHTLRRR